MRIKRPIKIRVFKRFSVLTEVYEFSYFATFNINTRPQKYFYDNSKRLYFFRIEFYLFFYYFVFI